MLNKKFFLLIGVVLFGSVIYSTNDILTLLNNKIDRGIDWAGANKVDAAGLAGISAIIVYTIFQEPIKAKLTEYRDTTEAAFWDAWIKWEDIKEGGPTKSDCLRGILALTIAGAIGGIGYHYGPAALMQKFFIFCGLTRTYKIEIGAALLGVIIARYLYKIKCSLDGRRSNDLNYDKFLAKLTDEQRRIIFNSEDLLVAIGKAEDNHQRLLENSEFIKLLTREQKSYLENVVRHRCSAVRNI